MKSLLITVACLVSVSAYAAPAVDFHGAPYAHIPPSGGIGSDYAASPPIVDRSDDDNKTVRDVWEIFPFVAGNSARDIWENSGNPFADYGGETTGRGGESTVVKKPEFNPEAYGDWPPVIKKPVLNDWALDPPGKPADRGDQHVRDYHEHQRSNETTGKTADPAKPTGDPDLHGGFDPPGKPYDKNWDDTKPGLSDSDREPLEPNLTAADLEPLTRDEWRKWIDDNLITRDPPKPKPTLDPPKLRSEAVPLPQRRPSFDMTLCWKSPNYGLCPELLDESLLAETRTRPVPGAM
jgi:hypothetical protein